MNSKLTVDDLARELRNLKSQYASTLETMADRVAKAQANLQAPQGGELGGTISTHDGFNMGATASELSILAGKIAQTENVIRWMAGN
jgi:hypothetical protein